MAKIILSINAGSSSVKISVYKAEEGQGEPRQVAEIQIAGLTAPPAKLSYQAGGPKVKDQQLDRAIKSQDDAFNYMLDHLVKDYEGLPELSRRDDIAIACHRVVHGGDYEDARVITQETYTHLEALTDLAPLHNASALTIVRSCVESLPSTKNVAYFDSAFHHTIPPYIHTYAIDQKRATKNKLRKYGFHGISYAFITRSVAAFLQKPESATSIIALHLGSGASACAIQHGKSLDTSMGLTPLAGLPGATRSGDVDPSLVFHFSHDAGKPSPSSTKDMHLTTAEEILNKKSGWSALTGTTDFGQVSSSMEPSHRLAFDMLVDRIVGFVGAYFVRLSGKVDALVFAGGIGERGDELRRKVVEQCECLGLAIDDKANEEAANGEDVVTDISRGTTNVRTLIVKTDEQYEMARACVARPEL